MPSPRPLEGPLPVRGCCCCNIFSDAQWRRLLPVRAHRPTTQPGPRHRAGPAPLASAVERCKPGKRRSGREAAAAADAQLCSVLPQQQQNIHAPAEQKGAKGQTGDVSGENGVATLRSINTSITKESVPLQQTVALRFFSSESTSRFLL